MAIIKRTEIMYKERNKLFIESGLGDYAYSDAEIEKYIVEAMEKEIGARLDKIVKESGL